MFSYEKSTFMNKAIDKVFSNNKSRVTGMNQHEGVVSNQVQMCQCDTFTEYSGETGLKLDPQYTILLLKWVDQGVEGGAEVGKHTCPAFTERNQPASTFLSTLETTESN